MLGYLLAGTAEAPGDYFYKGNVRVKRYRGMGSLEAQLDGGEKRYFSSEAKIPVAHGVSGTVVDRGPVSTFIPHLMQGVRDSLQKVGYRDLAELQAALASGDLRFARRSSSAQTEGTVHGLHSFTEPTIPNR